MKRITFLLLAAMAVIGCHGQKTMSKGFRVGDNDNVVIDSIESVDNNLYFYDENGDLHFFLPAINPMAYGADPTGVNDSQAAFQEAVDSAASQGRGIIIPTGTYKILDEIASSAFNRDNPLMIQGMGNVILDASSATSNFFMFSVDCAYGSDSALLASPSQGDTLIKTNLIDVERGDVLEILSTDYWGSIAAIPRRELVMVRRQSNDTIFLYTPLYDDYDHTTTGVKKTNAGRALIENVQIKMNPDQYQGGIEMRYFRDISIRNVHMTGTFHMGIIIYTSLGGVIENCSTDETLRDGFGYGVSLQAAQGITIQNNKLYGGRHCIEMGSCSRGNTVINNTVYAGYNFNYPLDNHESCEYNRFIYNTSYGGIYMRGVNSDINFNTFYQHKSGPAGIHYQIYGYRPRHSIFHNAIGNKIISLDDNSSYSIRVEFSNEYDTIDRLNISNNTCINSQHNVFSNLDRDTLKGNHIETILMTDNDFTNTDAARSNCYFSDSITIGNMKVSGGQYVSAAVGFGVSGTLNSGNVTFNGVDIYSQTYPLSISLAKFENIIVKNCHLSGSNYNNLDCNGSVVFQNNILEDLEDAGLHIGPHVQTFTYDGNVKINCTGTMTNNAVSTNTGDNW